MRLTKYYLKQNKCYINKELINVKGIMIHSTGVNNPYLKRYVGPDDGLLGINNNNNHWNKLYPDGRSVCVHAFIGKLSNGSIATYQTLPWNYKAWHCGGKGNNSYIGIEICEDSLRDKHYFDKVYKEAIELCAHLCKLYNIDPLIKNKIICHSEAYKLGFASNHSDVLHWFPKHGKTMENFRGDVDFLIKNNTHYKVKVLAKELNIRKGPGIVYTTVGSIKDSGIYTIVKESNGWGLLKSKIGWIRLSYTKKI